MKIGYLCSEFPALSHTFISREIEILERRGLTIATASINPTRNLEKMGSWDQERASRTYCLKQTSPVRILGMFFSAVLRLPGFLRALGSTLKLTWLSGPRDPLKGLGYFVQALLLDSWAHSNQVSHVHVHFANPAATVALLASRLGRLDFSLSVHGPDEFYDVERNNLREKVEAAVFVRCIGFYCRSQLMRLSSAEHWSKLHIVRCGLHRDEFVPREPRVGPARSLLCVGRVCPAKGQSVLVQAAAELKKRGRAFSLLLLGGGEDLEMIRALVRREGLQDCVEVAGPVGHSRVKEELARTDLFVLPSFAEGIPVALMEAMAAGVPVISTDITGIPELIAHGSEGFLTQPSNVVQLADTIDAFLLGTVDTVTLQTRAREKVAAQYDVDVNTRQLGTLFESLKG